MGIPCSGWALALSWSIAMAGPHIDPEAAGRSDVDLGSADQQQLARLCTTSSESPPTGNQKGITEAALAQTIAFGSAAV